MNKAFEQDDISERPLILWGGQMYGEMAYHVITHLYHGNVEAVIDNKYKRVPWCGLETLSASELKYYEEADVIICAANAFQEIYNELCMIGDKIHVYDCRSILADYRNEYISGKVSLDHYLYGDIDLEEIIDKYNYYAGEDNGYQERLYLPYCVLCITSKCSLKCKNCAAFVTKYQQRSDYTLEYVKSNFTPIVNAVDGIGELELMGGEPFLCSELNEILLWCIKQDKIHAIKIVTNGTIMPKDATWEIMQHHKVKLVIDDYGKLSRNRNNLVERAKLSGVRFEQQKLRTWYKIEPVIKKNFSEEKLNEIFNKCNFRTCVGLTNGRFYHCNVCGHMNTVGLLADEACEYLQMEGKEWDAISFRKELKRFLAVEYLKSCDYCNLYMNEEVKVAEQA